MPARANDSGGDCGVEDPFEIRLERLNEEYFLRMIMILPTLMATNRAGRNIANTASRTFGD